MPYIQPFCWTKPACFDFSSSNFNVQGHILRSDHRWWYPDVDPCRVGQIEISSLWPMRYIIGISNLSKLIGFKPPLPISTLNPKLWTCCYYRYLMDWKYWQPSTLDISCFVKFKKLKAWYWFNFTWHIEMPWLRFIIPTQFFKTCNWNTTC